MITLRVANISTLHKHHYGRFKLNNLLFNVEDTIHSVEEKLKLLFPAKVKEFLSVFSGLQTTNPRFEILDLKELRVEGNLIRFAIFDQTVTICFKVDKLNNAGEWTIIEKETQFELTQTISSFWTNKIWHWLEKRHKIWADNWWKK